MTEKQNLLEAGCARVQVESMQELQDLFEPWLALPEDFGGEKAYKSLYAPERTFWLFLSQVLAQDGACRDVQRCFHVWLTKAKGKLASASTAAYCKARKRLREEDLIGVHRQVAQNVEAQARPEDMWHGRHVKVIDGSSVSMPDTPENQARYPQPSAQKKGCGFPVMRIVVIFSLATGTLLEWARGALAVHERTLYRSLWDQLEPGDVALNDRGFAGYADFHYLKELGIDSVTRNHQRRKKTELIKNLGDNDRIVLWRKMPRHNRPKWMSEEEWQALPDTLTVRQITVTVDSPGFRSEALEIVTTLLDPEAYPADDIAELYRRRWAVELYLRHIKTTMNMDILRCKTPEMVEKEMWMHVIAYNLVRAIMLDAATTYEENIEKMSFKGTIATIRPWAPALAQVADTDKWESLYGTMLYYIAKDLLPGRPGRIEPRAVKRRPKNYPLLNKPRREYEETPHRSRYKKPKC
jgi:hypothetical protein